MRRLGRTAVVLCVLMAGGGLMLGGPAAAAGVIGGGCLVGISFYALSTATAALTDIATAPDRRRVMATALLKLAGRYALLGFLAYVMIARLRLHPLGLVAGASSVAAAAFVEAVRLLTKKSSERL